MDTIERLSRRRFLGAAAAGAASLALSACTSSIPRRETIGAVAPTPVQPNYDLAYYQNLYSARVDEGYELPAIPVERIDPAYLRQMVPDPTGEAPGTIVVDQSQHYLYLVMAETLLRKQVSPKAAVATFGWFFPTVRDHGERVLWKAEELAEGRRVLSDLCALAASGAFPSPR